MRIRRELELREGNKFIAIYPAETYSVSYTIDFPHALIGRETFRVDLSDGNYLREIAPARTFGFLHEADAMRQQGLIRGASPENAIVLTPEGLMNPPLRYPDEFVRHKVLDLIGDLALAGKQILGSIVADRAGHAMHTASGIAAASRQNSLGRNFGGRIRGERWPDHGRFGRAPRLATCYCFVIEPFPKYANFSPCHSIASLPVRKGRLRSSLSCVRSCIRRSSSARVWSIMLAAKLFATF